MSLASVSRNCALLVTSLQMLCNGPITRSSDAERRATLNANRCGGYFASISAMDFLAAATASGILSGNLPPA